MNSQRSFAVIAGFVFLLTAFCLSSTAFGQSSTATLSGTVQDQNGAAIPGVTITAINKGTQYTREVTSNGDGYFTIPLLPPGSYVLKARAQGFSPLEFPEVILNVGDNKGLQVQLKAGDVNAQVTIDSDAETVRTDGSVGTVVNRSQIANMPLNGRSLHALIQLTPGVVLTQAGGGSGATGVSQFSVNGQRTTSNNFMVDGVSANTGITSGVSTLIGSSGAGTAPGTTVLGGTNSLVSLDALQEFRIETSSYGAEFGRVPGGQISLVTRSGGNDYHGSASYYFRNEALDANEWFANSRSLRRPPERQSLFGGVLGGPLYLPRFGEVGPAVWSGKDRAFFFFSYEGLRLEQPQTGIASVPTPVLRSQAPVAFQPFLNALPLPNGRTVSSGFAEFNATYSDPSSFNIWSLRLDTNVARNLTSFFRINRAASESQRRGQSLSSIGDTSADQDSYTGGLTWVAGSRLTGDVRVNWTRNFPHTVTTLDAIGGAVVPDASRLFLPGWNPSNSRLAFAGVNMPGFTWGQGLTNIQRQFNPVATGAWSVGAHQLKFGVDYRRLLPIIRGTAASGESAFFLSAAGVRSGRAFLYGIDVFDPLERRPVISSVSLFAQDAWHAGRRLTLTYGLRFERVPPPSEANGRLPRSVLGIENNAIVNPRLAPIGTPTWHSRFGEFAPRFGASYQLSDRKGWESTVRGGTGIFYDLGLGSIVDAFAGGYPFRTTSSSCCSVPFPAPAEQRIPPTPGALQDGTALYVLDPDLRLPYTIQWNTSWEQTLGTKQIVTVSYVGAAGRRLLMRQSSETSLADNPAVIVALNIQRPAASSSYRALQLQFQRRLDPRLQVLSSYTLASSQDNASDENLESGPSLSTFLAQEMAASAFDVRHVFSAGVTYEVPKVAVPGFVEAMTKDWGLDLLIRYQSAFPVSPATSLASLLDANGVFFAVRPDLVSGQPLYLDDALAPGGRRFNGSAFTPPPTDQNGTPLRQGNFPRNGLRGFPASQVDLALRRDFRLGERVSLQLRAELFNLFNHPNFVDIDTNIDSSTFGRAKSTMGKSFGGLNALYQMGGPRSGQLAAKIVF